MNKYLNNCLKSLNPSLPGARAAAADILNLKIRSDKYLKTYSTQRPNFLNLSYVAVLPIQS